MSFNHAPERGMFPVGERLGSGTEIMHKSLSKPTASPLAISAEAGDGTDIRERARGSFLQVGIPPLLAARQSEVNQPSLPWLLLLYI